MHSFRSISSSYSSVYIQIAFDFYQSQMIYNCTSVNGPYDSLLRSSATRGYTTLENNSSAIKYAKK